MKRRRMLVALSLVTVLSFFACDPFQPVGFFINVGIQNSLIETMDLGIQGPEDDDYISRSFEPGYTSLEVEGTSGQRVRFLVGNAFSGEGDCIATNAIVGTSEYGQVNFFLGSGTEVIVECFSGWLEFELP